MIEETIGALPGAQAIAALQLVLERQGHAADPVELRADQAHLIEALNQPKTRQLAEPDPHASEGDLARTALAHLAADPATRDLVNQAITITASNPGDSYTREPVTLAVGALVLLALRTDLRIEHDPRNGWTFKLRTKPLSDTTIGKLLGQLLGTYLNH